MIIHSDETMGEQLSELGVKENVQAHKKKVMPNIRAVHEIKKDDFSMKVMDHNYYVQERWEDYSGAPETFIAMIYRRISNILH